MKEFKTFSLKKNGYELTSQVVFTRRVVLVMLILQSGGGYVNSTEW